MLGVLAHATNCEAVGFIFTEGLLMVGSRLNLVTISLISGRPNWRIFKVSMLEIGKELAENSDEL